MLTELCLPDRSICGCEVPSSNLDTPTRIHTTSLVDSSRLLIMGLESVVHMALIHELCSKLNNKETPYCRHDGFVPLWIDYRKADCFEFA